MNDDDELLLKASQLAGNLKSKFIELHRREQTLNEQLSQLDQEQRNHRLQVGCFEDEARQKSVDLTERELAVDAKFAEAQLRLDELEERERKLTAAEEDLSQRRTHLKEDLSHELALERVELEQTQNRLESERRQLKQLTEKQSREHQAKLEELQRFREHERQRLRVEIAGDVDHERAALEQEQEEWRVLRDAERANVEHAREAHESSIARSRTEIEQERAALNEELADRQLEFDERHATATQHQIEQRQRFEQEKAEVDAAVRNQRQQLDRLHKDIENVENQLLYRLQKEKCQFQQNADTLRQHARQLDRYRQGVKKREQSLIREEATLESGRQLHFDELRQRRDMLKSERAEWQKQRKAEMEQTKRQHEQLGLHAENLEGRRARLEQLRSTIEDTHRKTLETRMAIEEAWAQLIQTAGESVAEQRLAEARSALTDYYRGPAEIRDKEIERTLQQQRAAQIQMDELRRERERLTEWADQREDGLRQREKQLSEEAHIHEQKEAAWKSTREIWLQEKMQAEQIIRGLLVQIADCDAATGTVLHFRIDESRSFSEQRMTAETPDDC